MSQRRVRIHLKLVDPVKGDRQRVSISMMGMPETTTVLRVEDQCKLQGGLEFSVDAPYGGLVHIRLRDEQMNPYRVIYTYERHFIAADIPPENQAKDRLRVERAELI